MSYLHINGYAVPIVSCEPSHVPIGSAGGYSPNGVYQFARNGYARTWKCRTASTLTSDIRAALQEVLGHRGDHWRFEVPAANRPLVLGDTAAPFYSDKFRAAYNASGLGNNPRATIESCFAADGALVHASDGVALRPWAGATGSVLCEPGTTNILTAGDANPEDHTTDLVVRGSATLSTWVSRRWIGSKSIRVQTTASASPFEGVATNNVTSGYSATNVVVASVHLRPWSGGETLVLNIEETTGGAYTEVATVDITLPANTDTWTRYYLAYTTSGSSTGIRAMVRNKTAAAQYFFIDGLQLEVQSSGLPTSWVDPSVNTYGSGNGVRPVADLQYQNMLTSYVNGITLNAWVKHNRLGSGETLYVFDQGNASGDTRLILLFNNADQPAIQARAPDADGPSSASDLVAAGSALADSNWHMWTGVFDPSVPKVYLYKDGVEIATDTTLTGNRVFDPSLFVGDLHLANPGSGTASWGPGYVACPSVLPFAAPAAFVSGMYNSGNGYGGKTPGVLPVVVSGNMLRIGEQSVKCIAQLDAAPHAPWWNGSTFEEGGGPVAFTLTEAQIR